MNGYVIKVSVSTLLIIMILILLGSCSMTDGNSVVSIKNKKTYYNGGDTVSVRIQVNNKSGGDYYVEVIGSDMHTKEEEFYDYITYEKNTETYTFILPYKNTKGVYVDFTIVCEPTIIRERLTFLYDTSDIDSDGDGYSDSEDLNPNVPFVSPVILLHGWNGNSYGCYGVETNVANTKKTQNNNFNSNFTLDGKSYVDVDTHKIIKTHPSTKNKAPYNLGYELEKNGYIINKNLFAFNYPNQDIVKVNANLLSLYIHNLAIYMANDDMAGYFYATRTDMEHENYSLMLIGHSYGGLVARYYIENMGCSRVVEKLITISTPHLGTGLISLKSNSLIKCPADVDLMPDSALFGGTHKYNISLNPFVKETLSYIDNNQTEEFNYNKGNSKYYFIAGLDIAIIKDLPSKFKNKDISFVFTSNVSTLEKFKSSFENSMKNNSKYPELITNKSYYKTFKRVLDLEENWGDGVINIYSQLGLKYNWDNGRLLKEIKADERWISIDTFTQVSKDQFHSEIQHRKETISKVLEYLKK